MAYDIGTARGVIEMEYNGRGIDQAKQDLNALDDSGKKAGVTLQEASRTTGRAGLVIAAGLGAGVAAAANFEQRMSAVEAVSGATSAEMDTLSQKALDLGAKTSFSAGEAASAIEELVKAGLSVDEVMGGAADATVALAAAGEIALPEAATIASNALNQFNLQAQQLPKVADTIAGAANASAISVSDLGQSMQQAGAVANLAGVSFDDTATAIALMGNAGIRGSDAGTSLKSMLMRLQPTTTAQYNEMQRLGIITMDTNKAMEVLAQNGIQGVTKTNADAKLKELAATLSDSEVGSAKAEKKFRELGLQTGYLSNQFYDAKGNTKGLADISDILSGSLENMNKRQKQAALQVLFGSDAIRAAAILSNEGAKGFDKMSASMQKTTAAEVAAKRLDNFKGSLEAFKGSLETLGITFGTLLLPPLRAIVDALTQLLNWFTGLSKGTQTAIVATLGFVAAALLVASAVMKIIIFIGKFQAALAGLRVALAGTWVAALGPIALVVAAIAAVVAIIILLWNKSETFKNAVLAIWTAIQAGAQAIATWFMGTFVPALQAVWDAIVSGTTTAWNMIKTVITVAINIIKTIVTGGLNAIKSVWTAVWNTFGPLVKAVWGLIAAIIRLYWTIIKGIVLTGVAVVRAAVTTGFNVIKAVTSSIWNAIKAVIQAVWNAIKPFVTASVNAIKNVIQTAWHAVTNITKTVWNGLKPIISGAIEGVMSLVNGIKGKVLGALDFAGEMYAKGKAIIQGLIDGIASMIGKVTDIINSITDKVAKYLPGSPVKEGPLRKLNRGHAGKEIVQMVINGIEAMQSPLAVAMDGVMPTATVPLETPTGSVKRKKAGPAPMNMGVSGVLTLDNGVAYISGIAEDVFDGFNDDNNRRNR